ncbi:permease-like cell division protein FtsX [Cellvibrio sp. PSBB023]|uniref:permease-like cell division protein FtsX n=1 Tax=Cellvibrio sp. PSBB023 TaxID=1945512 RepID=UPI0009902DBB|nr:permease-like cell division protein FtsX [Cellvibrio sp. PSBB023]
MKSNRPQKPERRNRMGASQMSRAERQQRSPRVEQPVRAQGAVQSQMSWRDKFDAWSAHHSNSAIESLLRMLETPLQSAMTWLVIAIAIALPAALFIVFSNLQHIGQAWQDSSQVSVFLKKDVNATQAQDLRGRLAQRPDVLQASYISPEQALAEFKQGSGLGELASHLDENPLPGVILITPKMVDNTPAALAELQQLLVANPLVADVRLDMLWVKRLHQFIALAERFVTALAGLLALGVLLVIGNTIRMAIENRRDEILVVKLVGGTDAYVRRPFLYTGLWFGVGGGIVASLLLAVGFWWLAAPVAQLADLYQSSFRLQGLGFIESLQLILLAGVTGLIGAWIAVARHLYQIQPR